MSFHVINPQEFAKHCFERSQETKFVDQINFAHRWAVTTEKYAAQYDSAIQESILPALQIANNARETGDQYWHEGDPLVVEDFEVIMGAAQFLSLFWDRRLDFVAWTLDAPFRNKFGNWIDPALGTVLEDHEAAAAKRNEILAQAV